MDKVKANQILIMPDWVYQATPEPSHQAIYHAIRSFIGAEKTAFPTRQRIATRARLSCSAVDRALKHFKEIGAIVVEHRYRDNKQVGNLYVFKDDRPVKFDSLNYADKYLTTSDEVSICLTTGDNDTSPPVTNRTISNELEPIKEKENIKEKETPPKIDEITEFINLVKAIYPQGCRNPEWASFSKRVRKDLKTAAKRDEYLTAVKVYKATNPNPGFVKQPASLINKMDDYQALPSQGQTVSRREIEIEDWDGDVSPKVIKIAPWKEMRA